MSARIEHRDGAARRVRADIGERVEQAEVSGGAAARLQLSVEKDQRVHRACVHDGDKREAAVVLSQSQRRR
eukprot:4134955-Pleurochrysis_carterae.AAC.1